MKPPTMMVAPFGIMATASSAETALMIGLRSDRRSKAFGIEGRQRADGTPLICIKDTDRRSAAKPVQLCRAVTPIPSSISSHSLRTCNVPPSRGRVHGLAQRQQVGALQQQDLRLHERGRFRTRSCGKAIVNGSWRRRSVRQQCRRPYARRARHGRAPRYRSSIAWVRSATPSIGLRQPGRFPGRKQIKQFRDRAPRRSPGAAARRFRTSR